MFVARLLDDPARAVAAAIERQFAGSDCLARQTDTVKCRGVTVQETSEWVAASAFDADVSGIGRL